MRVYNVGKYVDMHADMYITYIYVCMCVYLGITFVYLPSRLS